MSDKKDFLFLARAAEQTERFEEMAEYALEFSKLDPKLNVEERNTLYMAFRNILWSRRSAWRAITSIEEKEEEKNNQNNVGKLKAYRNKIEQEILKICMEIITLIEELLVPNSDNEEAKIFFIKMKGDYLRYMAESTTLEEKSKYASKAKSAYEEAQIKAEEHLPFINPIRLGIALNFSVLYYEILNDSTKACIMAKTAYGEGIANIHNAGDDAYKDVATIMSLLRDNLTCWTSEHEAGDVDQM